MNQLKIKSFLVLSLATILDFTLFYYSKLALGDSVNRVSVRDMILTSFYLLVFLLISNIVLLCFSDKIFKLWLKKIMIWFTPLALIMVAIGAEEVNFGWPTRTDAAINMGVIMVTVTIVFAFAQRFYFKVK